MPLLKYPQLVSVPWITSRAEANRKDRGETETFKLSDDDLRASSDVSRSYKCDDFGLFHATGKSPTISYLHHLDFIENEKELYTPGRFINAKKLSERCYEVALETQRPSDQYFAIAYGPSCRNSTFTLKCLEPYLTPIFPIEWTHPVVFPIADQFLIFSEDQTETYHPPKPEDEPTDEDLCYTEANIEPLLLSDVMDVEAIFEEKMERDSEEITFVFECMGDPQQYIAEEDSDDESEQVVSEHEKFVIFELAQ